MTLNFEDVLNNAIRRLDVEGSEYCLGMNEDSDYRASAMAFYKAIQIMERYRDELISRFKDEEQ